MPLTSVSTAANSNGCCNRELSARTFTASPETRCRLTRAFRLIIGTGVVVTSLVTSADAASRVPAEPGWVPVVIARGELREEIEATPIENRPYRPLHFYGNTVRRMHYRGTPFPQVGEMWRSRR